MLAREAAGAEVPELLSRPAVPAGWLWAWQAFERLSTERQMGASAWGQIPHSAAASEALREGLDWAMYHELWVVVQALDQLWLSVANKPTAPQHRAGAKGGRLPGQDHSRPVTGGRRKQDRSQ